MTELDYLMAAIHDCGWQLAVHSWRDQANFAMAYELRDANRRYMLIRVSDQALAMAHEPQVLVYDAVTKLLQEYFVKELKSPQSFRAVRLLAQTRMAADAMKIKATV